MITPLDYARFAIDCGGRVSNSEAQALMGYFDRLSRRERLISITAQGQLQGFCAFFLLDREADVPIVHHRAPWTTPPDVWNGHIAFIDLVAAPRWTRALREELTDLITWRYPTVTVGLWYRVLDGQRSDRQCRWRVRREALHGTTL